MTRTTRIASKTCALAAAVLLASPVAASAQEVTIVYPIDGGTYPITDPSPGPLYSSYFTASFSVSCGGGPHLVEWGFDDDVAVGSALFYDQVSEQQVWKLTGGRHRFWVDAGSCGDDSVRFQIGS